MFTGIIETTGTVSDINDSQFTFTCSFASELVIGESVAVNGMCVTVTGTGIDWFTADVIEESRRCTIFSEVEVGTVINLERSAVIGSRNSGHAVLGHVDETGEITDITQQSDFWLVRVKFSNVNWPLVIYKGSITIDGISLTVSSLGKSDDEKSCWLEVSIIPHTWTETNLHTKHPGDRVNLEFDQVGKYLAKQGEEF